MEGTRAGAGGTMGCSFQSTRRPLEDPASPCLLGLGQVPRGELSVCSLAGGAPRADRQSDPGS